LAKEQRGEVKNMYLNIDKKALEEAYKVAQEIRKKIGGTVTVRLEKEGTEEFERDFVGAGFKNCASHFSEIVYKNNVELIKKEAECRTIAPEILMSGHDCRTTYTVHLKDKSKIGVIVKKDKPSNTDASVISREAIVIIIVPEEIFNDEKRRKEVVQEIDRIWNIELNGTYHYSIRSYIYTKTWEGGFIISLRQKKILYPHAKFGRSNNYFLKKGKYIVVKSGGYSFPEESLYTVGPIRIETIEIAPKETEMGIINSYSAKITVTPENLDKLPETPLFTAIKKIYQALLSMSEEPYHSIPSPPETQFTKAEIKALLSFVEEKNLII